MVDPSDIKVLIGKSECMQAAIHWNAVACTLVYNQAELMEASGSETSHKFNISVTLLDIELRTFNQRYSCTYF